MRNTSLPLSRSHHWSGRSGHHWSGRQAITGRSGAITGGRRAITGAVGGAITGAVGGAITGAVVRAITGAVVGAITGAVVGAITGAVVVVAGATANVVGKFNQSEVDPPPSPGIISKEDPKLLSPRSWNEDKSIKSGGSKGSSKSNSRPSSRPTTPATSAPPTAAPESTEAPGSRGPSRTPSRQSSKNEQGSHLEIKPLQKFDSEEPAPDVVVLHLLPLYGIASSLKMKKKRAAPRVQSAIKSRHPRA
ncbi:Chromodomain-helicase-DNA-binding protein 3 [Dissostichus eleginoides]|uniref:Chromodomain-helicase-DNA-binding protein 3 n=1 Tax=Dissostichus eleginoides TaxID=100907 RepID=A0AAD9F0U9_DISEL|nr:Chromodomain-helicase-DNA-binding protein 3 [Dissostichus eleginoides]